jgi:hypothetical protein
MSSNKSRRRSPRRHLEISYEKDDPKSGMNDQSNNKATTVDELSKKHESASNAPSSSSTSTSSSSHMATGKKSKETSKKLKIEGIIVIH